MKNPYGLVLERFYQVSRRCCGSCMGKFLKATGWAFSLCLLCGF
jgi:hypothetical protein